MPKPKRKKEPTPTGPGKCRLCPRWENGRVVCMEGHGPTQPELVVVGEAPSTMEDQWCRVCDRPQIQSCEDKQHARGVPFVGPAGQILDRALREAGWDPARVFKTNAVRCCGPNPTMLESRKCRPYILTELAGLDWSQCKAVFLLGAIATKAVLNQAYLAMRDVRLRDLDRWGPVGPLEGSRSADPAETKGEVAAPLIRAPLRATVHPAACLPGRDPTLYDELMEDLRSAWKPRDPIKPVKEVRTARELEAIFGSSPVVSLDLEWAHGRIRLAGLSDGVTNVSVVSMSEALQFLRGPKRGDPWPARPVPGGTSKSPTDTPLRKSPRFAFGAVTPKRHDS